MQISLWKKLLTSIIKRFIIIRIESVDEERVYEKDAFDKADT